MSTSTSVNSTGKSASEERALALLGSGLGPEIVASACGVSVSRISQLLSTPEFLAEVSELRFRNLQKHNLRDDKYDSLEDRLLKQLEDVVPLLMRPMELLKAIQVINAAKRRGHSAPQEVNNQQTIVSIVIPIKVVKKFSTNVHNQVIQVGTQDLTTVQSNNMDRLLGQSKKEIQTPEVGVPGAQEI